MACELEVIALAESQAAYVDHLSAATVAYAEYLEEIQAAMISLNQLEQASGNLEYCLNANGGSGSGSGTGSGSGGGSSSGGGTEGQRIIAPIEAAIDRVHRDVQEKDAAMLLDKCRSMLKRLAGRSSVVSPSEMRIRQMSPPVTLGPRMRNAMKRIQRFCNGE